MREKGGLVIIAVEHQELRHSVRRLISDHFERMIFADDMQSLQDSLASTSPDLILVELSLPTEGPDNSLKILGKGIFHVPTIVIGDYEEEEVFEETPPLENQIYVQRNKLSADLIPALLNTSN